MNVGRISAAQFTDSQARMGLSTRIQESPSENFRSEVNDSSMGSGRVHIGRAGGSIGMLMLPACQLVRVSQLRFHDATRQRLLEGGDAGWCDVRVGDIEKSQCLDAVQGGDAVVGDRGADEP